MYGPRKTVPTVVLKDEFAQSYIAQPKISRLSFTVACDVAMLPPDVFVWKILSIKTPFAAFRLRKFEIVLESAHSRKGQGW